MKFLLFLPAILVLCIWWIEPYKRKVADFTIRNQRISFTVSLGSFTVARDDWHNTFSKPSLDVEYIFSPEEYPDIYKVPFTVNLIGTIYPYIDIEPGKFSFTTPMWIVSLLSFLAPVVWLKRRNSRSV